MGKNIFKRKRWIMGEDWGVGARQRQKQVKERKKCENKSSSGVPKTKLLWRHYFSHDSCSVLFSFRFSSAKASVCVDAFVFMLVCFFVSDVLIHHLSNGFRNWLWRVASENIYTYSVRIA